MEHVGAELRVARERKNVSLGQVAEATRISRTNLERLEECRYKELPGGVYNRAFIRAYCEYLGLESKEMLARYEEETAPLADKPYRAKDKSNVFREPIIRPHPLFVWGLMLVISAAGLFFSRHWIADVFSPYFAHPAAGKITGSPAPSATAAVAKPQPAPVLPVPASETASASQGDKSPGISEKSSSVPGPLTQQASAPGGATPTQQTARELAGASGTPAQTQSTERPPGKLRLEIRVADTCWISVNSDGNRVLVRTLESGSSQVFDADERFFLVIGNAGAIHLKINGKPVRPLGKPGEVVRVLINEQSLKDLIEKSSN
jgi:cytoskeleton protein RodZ